ncbi:MAG: alpha/beta hydrolase [Ferruginibacter sp.]|nr:alpha/beta hydrolase [Ferruginibacter sp.]
MIFNKKIIYRWAKITALVYATIGIALYYLQDTFLFHPQKIESNYKYKFDCKTEEINIPFTETDTINMVKFFPMDSLPKGVVIYFHGNMKNINHYKTYVQPFIKNGYEVWMPDYPSFGKSTGTITEKKLYDQALQVKKMAETKYGFDSIIIFGKSLGTGIAAYVASNTVKAKMLILETPYYSIPSLFSCYAFIYPTNAMTNYKIPTYQYLQDVKYPIIIFHGTSDGVIPYKNASKLKPVLKPSDKFITISNATHQNVNSSKIYFDVIDSLLVK